MNRLRDLYLEKAEAGLVIGRKAALDGTYADMHGYSGHYEWRSFYAIFYMTAPFYTQKDVDAEFELVKADLSWKPMILVGPGQRKGKSTRGGAAPPA